MRVWPFIRFAGYALCVALFCLAAYFWVQDDRYGDLYVGTGTLVSIVAAGLMVIDQVKRRRQKTVPIRVEVDPAE